jgi:RimJ/RimL family protein N-acetyltransferase
VIFATQRFDVRPWRLDDHDVAGCFAVYSDPNVAGWLDMAPHDSPARARAGIERAMERAAADPHLGWWPIVERATGDILGQIGLAKLPDRDAIEIGWHVRSDHWNRGVGTEAAQGALQYGFTERGLERIISIALPTNFASQRVMEKIGMTRVEDTDYKGFHHVQYAITRDAWERQVTP